MKDKSYSFTLFAIFILGFSQLSFGQNDSTFKPAGKMIIQIINRSLFEIDGNTTHYGMYINRSHFGYRYQFSPQWAGAIIVDVGRPTLFSNLTIVDSASKKLNSSYSYQQGNYYTIGLKFSYIEYSPNQDIKLQAGGILQNHYITQEKFWGYRYILETFQDKYFGTPSGDLGFIGYFALSHSISIDVAMTNGEGFRNTQDANGKVKLAAGFDIKPIEKLTSRIYYDYSPSSTINATQQLLSVFLGYKDPSVFRIGAEYDYHKNHNFIVNQDLFGFSVFGSYEIINRVELFGRYDKLESNTPSGNIRSWHYANDGDEFMTGFHHSPTNGISLSINYQLWKPSDLQSNIHHTFAFSFEYKI